MGCKSSKNIENPTAAPPPPLKEQPAYSAAVYAEPIEAAIVKPTKSKGNIIQYPGQRRQGNASYIPDASDFRQVDGNTAVATKHFVSTGGNALTLVDTPPPSKFIEGK